MSNNSEPRLIESNNSAAKSALLAISAMNFHVENLEAYLTIFLPNTEQVKLACESLTDFKISLDKAIKSADF